MPLIDRDSLIGMVGGPLVWTVHFLVVYVLTAVSCAFGFASAEALGPVSLVLIAVSAAALAAIGGLGMVARRRLRRLAGGPGRDPETGRQRFMAFAALLLCVLSAIAVVYETIPVFVLPPCQ